MLLSELLNGLEILSEYEDREIADVTDKTHKISEGCAFVCVIGARFDGHSFAETAVKEGAKAVIVSRDMGLKEQIIVENTHAGVEKGFKMLINGEIPMLTSDYQEYNKNAIAEFKAIIEQ